jgi:hypothetical protein
MNEKVTVITIETSQKTKCLSAHGGQLNAGKESVTPRLTGERWGTKLSQPNWNAFAPVLITGASSRNSMRCKLRGRF